MLKVKKIKFVDCSFCCICIPRFSSKLFFLTISHFIFEWAIQLDCYNKYTHHTNWTHYRVWRKKPHNHNINNVLKHFAVYVSYLCSETALSGPRSLTSMYSLCLVVPLNSLDYFRSEFVFCYGVHYIIYNEYLNFY